MPYLLDTSICSHIIRANDDVFMQKALAAWHESAISAITVHELEMWAAATGQSRRERIQGFLDTMDALAFDAASAKATAKMQTALAAQSLAAYDALIAGHALALGYILVTADKGFKRVPGLRMENWLKA